VGAVSKVSRHLSLHACAEPHVLPHKYGMLKRKRIETWGGEQDEQPVLSLHLKGKEPCVCTSLVLYDLQESIQTRGQITQGII